MAQYQYPNAPQGTTQGNNAQFQIPQQNQYVIQNLNPVPLNQVQPAQIPIIYYDQQIAPQEQQLLIGDQALVKDLNFLRKKSYAMKILGFFVLWSFIYLLMLLLLLVWMETYKDGTVYGTLFAVTIVLTLLLQFFGTQKKNRKYSVALFLFTVVSYSFTYIALYSYCDTQTGFSFGWLIAVLCIVAQVSNILATVVFMIYLNCQEETFKVSGFMGTIAIIFVPLSLYFLGFFFFLNFVYVYSLLLGNVIKQIMDGRFELQKNQIVAGTLAASYGICIPCSEND